MRESLQRVKQLFDRALQRVLLNVEIIDTSMQIGRDTAVTEVSLLVLLMYTATAFEKLLSDQ